MGARGDDSLTDRRGKAPRARRSPFRAVAGAVLFLGALLSSGGESRAQAIVGNFVCGPGSPAVLLMQTVIRSETVDIDLQVEPGFTARIEIAPGAVITFVSATGLGLIIFSPTGDLVEDIAGFYTGQLTGVADRTTFTITCIPPPPPPPRLRLRPR